MPLTEPAFKISDVIQRVNQPEAIGVVADVRPESQTQTWNYVVQFPEGRRTVTENAIQLYVPTSDPWDCLAKNRLSGWEHFVYTLTYHRLRYPPARIARSFASARTQFYPHQFKPVLKFLENSGKRLLIADDVGLGKTIEAGYILRELDMRQGRLDRVLVLVPARLVPKWKKEMRNRFDEPFDAVKGSEIIGQAERLLRGRELDTFRWIISYESARTEEVRQALEETQLPIDLWIADEAHRMRNPETLQHKVGAALSRSADNIVFLSATPVQTALENLWHLLRLLSAEEFRDFPVFEQQMRSNLFLLKAQRALAEHPPDMERAHGAWSKFREISTSMSRPTTEFSRSVEERMNAAQLDHRGLVELQGDIGLLSPTAHIISRTRKVDALPNRPLRNAGWVSVALSDEERRIYDSVEELCRMAWGQRAGSWGFQMSLLMAYRITASCIPAAMVYFGEKLRGISSNSQGMNEFEVEEDDADNDRGDETVWTVKDARDRIQRILDSHKDASFKDSKLTTLTETLERLWDEDRKAQRPRRKVVLFSYFRRTLEYLSRSLRQSGHENQMIHGGVPVDEREHAIDDFLERPEFPLLLTSEVGGEGIDLQKACVVINYDLPWNPMVVEQRIGRVDRIGQESPIIYVINFVVEHSVEERILGRLLTRIRIFEESIGELDEIIGDQIEELAKKTLRGELADDDLERVLRQTEDAIGHRVTEARKMLSNVDSLLAADQALMDEINAVVGERQIPAERELLLFLNRFLEKRYPGCQLPNEAIRQVVSVDLHGPLAHEIEQCSASLGDDSLVFARRIGTGSISLTLSRDAAYRHSRAELVHLNHPICRFAIAELQKSNTEHGAAFSLGIRPGILPEGEYLFLLAFLHIPTFRPSNKMVLIVANRESRNLLTDPEQTTRLLLEILENGQDTRSQSLPDPQFVSLKERLLGGLNELKNELEARERKLDQARREQRYATQVAGFEFRLSRAQERLDRLRESGAQDFAVRMARFQAAKAQKERDTFVQAKPTSAWTGIEPEEVAVGMLYVAEKF
jgi:superfamily II DNA or RNA helicase